MEIFTHIGSTNYYLGTCERCDRPYRVVRGSEEVDARTLPLLLTIDCPGDCGLTLKVERLAAVTTEEVCDSRCMGATGPSCSCACGGANHGASWGTMATTYELESAVKALRARQERLARQKEQRAAAKQDRKQRVFDTWVAEGNSDVVEYLNSLDTFNLGGFLFDMVALVVRQSPLTERQADAVRRVARQEAARQAQQAVYEASKKVAPLGKGQTVEGTIISIKDQDGYAYGTTEWKMTVECDGFRVWGTVPRALMGTITPGWADRLKGQRIRLTAELVASKKGDPSFVIAKRPKAEKV